MTDLLPIVWGITGAVAAARRNQSSCQPLAWVTSVSRSGFTLVGDDGIVVVAGRASNRGAPDPVVGDVVRLGSPLQILDRRSALTRSRKDGSEQVLAANMDVVLLVVAAPQASRAALLERLGMIGWSSGASPVLLVSKSDMVTDQERQEIAAVVGETLVGVPMHFISARTLEGRNHVADLLKKGETGVLIGHSGAGKSTLTNVLLGADERAIGSTRERDEKGRHTTTARDVVALPGGGFIIDSPGVRELGVVLGADFEPVFGDIESLARDCRYGDCRHDGDDGCAVRAAVESGNLSADRVRRYLRLVREAQPERKGSPQRDKTREYARHARDYRRARGY